MSELCLQVGIPQKEKITLFFSVHWKVTLFYPFEL